MARARLKKISYSGFSHSSSGIVAYLLIEDRCVSSGLTDSQAYTSTINGAEEIIAAIYHAESILPCHQPLQFFDLQTWRGYRKEVGEFSFDRLSYAVRCGEIIVSGWQPLICPDHIIDAFSQLIGEPPRQTNCPA